MKKNSIYLIISAFVLLLTTQCKKDKENNTYNVVTQNIISQVQLDSIKALCPDIEFQTGNNVPTGMLGKFIKMQIIKLKCNNYGETNRLFSDSVKSFYKPFNFNSDNNKLNVYNVHYTRSENIENSISAYILGSSNKFTVYSKLIYAYNTNQTALQACIINGTYNNSIINNLTVIYIQLNDDYDGDGTKETTFPTGSIQVLTDNDGISEMYDVIPL